MFFRRGRIHWYDIVFTGLAAAIVYPDKILEWLSGQTGFAWGLLHLILVQAVAIGLMIVAMLLLMQMYPRLEWWHPLTHVGMLAGIRTIMWCLSRMFGFDD